MFEFAKRHHRRVTINAGRRLFLKQSSILLVNGLYGCGGGTGGSSERPDAIVDPAIIQTHPADQAVVSGNAATFQVVATGSGPLSYEWQRNGIDIPGANQAAYVLGSTAIADDGANFRVRVSNSAGTATSSSATLRVIPGTVAPTIIAEPSDMAVSVGQTATFEASAGGTAPLTYQWRRDGADIPGATGTSYTLMLATRADNGAEFSVAVSNQAGSVSSRAAILNVTSAGTTIDTTATRVDTILITVDEV